MSMSTNESATPRKEGGVPDLLCLTDSAYLIRKYDGTFVRGMPTDGRWYCGFVADESYAEAGVGCIGPDGKRGWRDEAIAQCVGDRDFYDGESEYDFGGYDWIAEQGP